MLPLFTWGSIGVVLHFLFAYVFTSGFDLKSALKMTGLCIILIAVGSYFASTANIAGWIMKAAFCAGGYLMCYLAIQISKLTIKNKSL